MAKRTVTAERLREIVRARLTKGDAFRLDNAAYVATQSRVIEKLAALSKSEIIERYPEYTYDVR